MVTSQSVGAESPFRRDFPDNRVPTLDDQPASLEPFNAILQEQGLSLETAQRLETFGNLVEDELQGKAAIPFFVLDMHLPRTPHLGGLNLPHVKTQGSTAVGLAVAQHYLFKKKQFIHTPVILLTGFHVKKDISDRVRLLQKRHKIKIVKKADISTFRQSILNILSENAGVSPKDQPQGRAMSVCDFLEEGVGVIDRIFDEWRLTPPERGAALGFGEVVSAAQWEEAKHDIRNVRNELFVQQIKLIARIKAGLAAIFQENEAAEALWLRQPLEALDGASAIELMTSGRQTDLAFLVRVVQRATG